MTEETSSSHYLRTRFNSVQRIIQILTKHCEPLNWLLRLGGSEAFEHLYAASFRETLSLENSCSRSSFRTTEKM